MGGCSSKDGVKETTKKADAPAAADAAPAEGGNGDAAAAQEAPAAEGEAPAGDAPEEAKAE